MKKLRLLLTDQCDRACPGCCNNDWDLDNLPIVESFVGYDEILITGGEPLMRPYTIFTVVGEIRRQTVMPIYLYTARTSDIQLFLSVLDLLDGVCVTLHDIGDVIAFQGLAVKIPESCKETKSLRLNVFKGLDISHLNSELSGWTVKHDIEWIKNCPLPEGEVFMRWGE